jgi:hypothetical protein
MAPSPRLIYHRRIRHVRHRENRNHENDRYLSDTPPRELLWNVAEQVAFSCPPENRERFLKITTLYYDLEAIANSMRETMVKVFTANELAALGRF